MTRYWVYIHTSPEGMKYVGVTTKIRPEIRWGSNGEGYLYNAHFRSAILKHGWNNFQHEVFEVDSAEEMYRKEVELIAFYHSNDPKYGYNNSVGGEHSRKGCTATPEQRKANSERQKGKVISPETRAKISATLKGRVSNRKGCTETEEQKRKISESSKGRSNYWLLGKPKPKFTWRFPDGSTKVLSKQAVSQHYLKKGIQVTLVEI